MLPIGHPEIIIIISGKRKAGKDFTANLLLERYANIYLKFILKILLVFVVSVYFLSNISST